jgi:hypothetical protein
MVLFTNILPKLVALIKLYCIIFKYGRTELITRRHGSRFKNVCISSVNCFTHVLFKIYSYLNSYNIYI